MRRLEIKSGTYRADRVDSRLDGLVASDEEIVHIFD
jgi:hypothetical protein